MWYLCTFSVDCVTLFITVHEIADPTSGVSSTLMCPFLFFVKAVFRKFDLDKSGCMSAYEMRMALESAGDVSHSMIELTYYLPFNSFVS